MTFFSVHVVYVRAHWLNVVESRYSIDRKCEIGQQVEMARELTTEEPEVGDVLESFCDIVEAVLERLQRDCIQGVTAIEGICSIPVTH